MSEPSPTITVLWTCGCYIGGFNPFDWEEPEDCPAEFETEETVWDWEEGLCRAQCPSCGAHLDQRDGHACTTL